MIPAGRRKQRPLPILERRSLVCTKEIPSMPMSRRQFTSAASLGAGALLAPALSPAEAQQGGVGPRPVPEVVKALKPLPAPAPAITDDEAGPHRKGATSHGRERARRHRARAGDEHHPLFRRRALGPERAPVPARDSGRRANSPVRSLGFRGEPGPRGDEVHGRRPGLAGGRRSLRGGRLHPRGQRGVGREGRHRGARSFLHRAWPAPGRSPRRVDAGHPGHRGLPHDQVEDGDRAHAARQQHHHRRLQGGAPDPARGHDPGRIG